MPKTGTTSIQDTLFHNTALLEKNGIKYLNEWGRNHFYKFRDLFSQYPVGSINIRHQNKKLINKMAQVVNTSKCETLVFSGEYCQELYHVSTFNAIKDFIKTYFQNKGIEISVILFIRNPLAYLISSLQQNLFYTGYVNKNCDYFETVIKQHEGIFNLQEHFCDSLKAYKFEDVCLDKDGLVGCFLKTIGFPEEELKNISVHKANESRCMEVMEFVHFVETIEPRYPYSNYRRRNANRFPGDFNILKDIKGTKFDLPYQSKTELWERLQKVIALLKENIDIDYTNYTIPPPLPQETYSEETTQGFIEAFPKLSFMLQRYFLNFFEKKYMETAQEKFKNLYFCGSIPWKVYNSKNALLGLIVMRAKYKLREINKLARRLYGH